MVRRFSLNFAIFSMAMDAIVIAAMLYLAAYTRGHLDEWLPPWPFVRDIQGPVRLPWPLFVLFPLVWVLTMLAMSVYDGRKNLRVVDEFTSLTLSAALAGMALAGILYLTYREVSRLLFVAFMTATYMALLLWRIPARLLYRRYRLVTGQHHRVLIAGAGPVGRRVEEALREHGDYITVVGFVDDDPAKRALPEVLGSLDDLRSLVQQRRIDDVVFALPLRAYARLNQAVWALHDLPVHVWIVPDYFQWTLHHAGVAEFGGLPMLDVRAEALTDGQRLVKRLFDILVTLALLVPLLPVMGLIALAIWLDDGPPILFLQQRVGENGRLFTMYKFRTMVRDAEKLRHLVEQVDEQGHLIHKRPDDPRVTRVGRWLRRWSLDELPQLFNVLRGDMSLVGPRPEMPYLVEKYQPWQRKRFAVPQGLTGWWQIHGRSDKPMHLHTEDDLYYIQNYSLWLDIKILIKTFWVVLRGKGAY